MQTAPDAYAYLCELDARSLIHEPGTPSLQGNVGWRGLAYRVGAHRLVSSYDDVVEILTLSDLTPVPGGQPWLMGLANVRGSLMPVVDLRLFLEGERSVVHQNHRMLALRQDGGAVAVLIDALYGQRAFDLAQVTEPELPEHSRYRHFVERAYRDDEAAWAVFDLSRLVRTPEFRQAAA